MNIFILIGSLVMFDIGLFCFSLHLDRLILQEHRQVARKASAPMGRRYRAPLLMTFAVLPVWGGSLRATQQQGILDRRLTMQVYPVEILESVINRLDGHLNGKITWDSRMLSPYKAKAADYREQSIREILDDQLSGTPIRYDVRKQKVVIYFSADDGKRIIP